jgi:ribonuclease E
MTRKRIGTGLLEAFSRPCEHCAGRGLIIEHEPIPPDQTKKPKATKSADKKKAPKSETTAKTAKKSKSSKTAGAPRQLDADGTQESPAVDSVDAAASPGPPTRSLLDRVEDDLPPAVTPRKRTRKRATRPAGQPTPTS